MEVAVANLLDYRKHIIVPNVSSGFFVWHEADLVVIDDKNRLTEVEIKVSVSDLKADFKKRKHLYPSKFVSRLIYAIPFELLHKCIPHIPPKFGVIVVKTIPKLKGEDQSIYYAEWYRQVNHNKEINPLSESQVRNLGRLGCMRIWSLKKHNNRFKMKIK